MAIRISASLLVVVVLFSLIGYRAAPALAAGLQCGSVNDLGIPAAKNYRFSKVSTPCIRLNIPPGVTRLRLYVWTQQGIANLYMGQTASGQSKLVIDTSTTGGAQVTRSKTPYNARSLTPGFLILALGPLNGSIEGDIVGIRSEIYKPPPPAPSSSGSVGSVSSPLDGSVDVAFSPVSVVPKVVVLGKVQPPVVVVVPPAAAPVEVAVPNAPAAPAEPATPAAPAESPTAPPPEASPPTEPPPQPQPAANTGNIDPFPCSRAGIGVSNLCIEQPYPVKRGSTAFVIWNIADFSYGEFDRGDGQGFKGPIYSQMRLDVPGINAPRTIRLRWQDKGGAEHIDSFTIQVID